MAGRDVSKKKPLDLILRVALVHDDGDSSFRQELSPSVWLRFKVSTHVNLDLMHDKLLAPIMGWTRNYHTYMFRKLDKKKNSCNISYVQQDTNAVDAMHTHMVSTTTIVSPESVCIGDLLTKVGDRALYVCDLGDSWRHVLTLEERITGKNGANGRVAILDGAMRGPNEDGEGCSTYQNTILDAVNAVNRTNNTSTGNGATEAARNLARLCNKHHNDANVRGPFRPTEFEVSICQQKLNEVLNSRNWARNSVKMFSHADSPFGARFLELAEPGQCFVTTKMEDDRFVNDDRSFLLTRGETINTKPDPIDKTLCNVCGNPLGLLRCSSCKSTQYCSKECQRFAWKNLGHKKHCAQELLSFKKYQTELNSEANATRYHASRVVDGGKDYLQKYDPENLRFAIGDRVECFIGPGENDFGTGTIVDTLWRCDSWPASQQPAPYQIQLDHGQPPYDLIFAQWDDDHQIRRYDDGAASAVSKYKNKHPTTETVD